MILFKKRILNLRQIQLFLQLSYHPLQLIILLIGPPLRLPTLHSQSFILNLKHLKVILHLTNSIGMELSSMFENLLKQHILNDKTKLTGKIRFHLLSQNVDSSHHLLPIRRKRFHLATDLPIDRGCRLREKFIAPFRNSILVSRVKLVSPGKKSLL